MGDTLGELVEFAAIAVIGLFALSLWKRASAQYAFEQTQLVKQRGYTGIEMMFADSVDRFLF